MKFTSKPVLATALGAMLLVFPMTGQAKIKIVATTTDLGWIAQEVGGPDAQIDVLCPGHRDPHTMPAKPSLARKLSKADLLIYNGMELEVGWLPLLVDAARNPRIRAGQAGELDCSGALAPDDLLEVPHGEVDRSQGDIHPLGNPHYTLDPRLGMKVGHLIAHRLAQLDPSGAEVYAHRSDQLDQLLMARLDDWQQRVLALNLRGIIVYHQQWEYLAHWLGLDILGVIENRPGISPAPRHVEQVIQMGRQSMPLLILAATWDHKDGAGHVARKIPCPLVVATAATGDKGYLELFESIINAMEKGTP